MTQSGSWSAQHLNMTGNRRFRWKRIAIEAVAIVGSILLAFAIDAWWTDQVEQSALRDTLRAVRVDFLETKKELTLVIDANETYIEGVMVLLSIQPKDIERMESARRAELANLLPTGGITFDPVLGSLDAFITSGQLNRVQNLDIRGLIGAWPGVMDEIGEDQSILIDMYMAQQERSIELGIYLMAFEGEISAEPADAHAKILLTAISDQEMLNRLAAHRFAAQSLNEELYEVRTHLNDILFALEQEIENKHAE